MLKPGSKRSRFSLPFAGAAAALVISVSSPAFSQDAPPTEEGEPPAVEAPAGPTPEKQAAAIERYKEGAALLAEKKYAEAIAKFEEAYENYPDIQIQIKIGEAFQRDGTESLDYDKLAKAVEAYKRFVAKVPEGETTDAVNGRIAEIEESIAAEEKRIQQEADDKKKEEEEVRLAEEAKIAKAKAKAELQKKMQIVLSGGLLAGSDMQLTGILRMSGGALLAWEKFAIEGKLGIDGFLQIDSEQGTRGRSFPVLDVGVRYGTKYRFVGPFVSGGASFGLLAGKPHERTLKNDDETCGGGTCTFDIDKAIAGRIGFGYGFRATETSTVALRVDLQGWLYSVDEEQGGEVRASSVEKPQTGLAVMFGLEFMRWL